MRKKPKVIQLKLQSPAVLKLLMRKDGFSIRRLALYSGCSPAFIGHLCSGFRNTCTPELGARIAEALRVETTDLFLPVLSTTEHHMVRARLRAA